MARLLVRALLLCLCAACALALSASLAPRRCLFPALRMGLRDSPLELSEEAVLTVLQEVRAELGTIFGYDARSREVGITGSIELAEVDGPTICVKLGGRFWHATVLLSTLSTSIYPIFPPYSIRYLLSTLYLLYILIILHILPNLPYLSILPILPILPTYRS